MLGQVDTHGLGSDLVVTDSLEGTAVGGVNKQHDEGNADGRHDKGEQNGIKVGKSAQQVGRVGQRPHLLPLDDGAHDLGKAQRGDGQIVALELEHRQADEPSKDSRHDARQNKTHDHGQAELHDAAVKILIHTQSIRHRDGEDAIGISADHHEARLPQGKQTREAVEQVQRHRHQRVDGAFFQNGGQHGVMLELIHIQQKRDADGCQDQ